MSRWSVTAATLALLLACATGENELDGLTKSQLACDQACTDPAQGGSLQYVGGLLCGARWTCRCALAGEPEASVCDPIVRVGIISATYPTGGATDPVLDYTSEAVTQMASWSPHLLAHAGDMVGRQPDYAPHLEALLQTYSLPGVPRLLTLGEQDVYQGPASVDVIRNAFPTDSSSWLQPGQLYGSTNLKGVHLVALDATYLEAEPATHFGLSSTTFNNEGYIPQAQRDWLAADLEATRFPTVIFLHPGTGIWNEAEPATRLDNAPELMAIFEAHKGKILAVINGHARKPMYGTVNGVNYFTVGAMVPQRHYVTLHDRGGHSQLEVDTEQRKLLYTHWENDSARGYVEVQRVQKVF